MRSLHFYEKSQAEILLIMWYQQLQINRKVLSTFIRRNNTFRRASLSDRLKLTNTLATEQMENRRRRALSC